MKNVYTVHGSEDGLIGVYSNIAKACQVAAEYSEGHRVSTSKSVELGVWRWVYEGTNIAEVEKWAVA